MDSFDVCMEEFLDFFDRKYNEGRPVCEYYAAKDTTFSKNTGIVLKSDTFAELGGPMAVSCAFSILSGSSENIQDGRVRLMGTEIERTETPYPFGQVIIASGKLDCKSTLTFGRCQHLNPGIEGYMVKSSVKNVWGRVSNSAGEAGLTFEKLGEAVITTVKDNFPSLEAVEVMFVNSSSEDVEELIPVADKAQSAYQAIKEQVWSARGINIYDCAFHGNCDSCGDKKACDGIRTIAKNKRR